MSAPIQGCYGPLIPSKHGSVVEGEWLACEHPERPFDPSWTVFQMTCRGCFLALKAATTTWWPDSVGIDLRTEVDPNGDHPVDLGEVRMLVRALDNLGVQ